MAIDKKRYPKNWKSISRYIRGLAGHRCEFCGVPNRAYRRKPGTEFTTDPTLILRWRELYGNVTRIVLSVAHLDHNPEKCHRDNLRALCQACHLAYDLPYHVEQSGLTRIARRIARYRAAGQCEINFDTGDSDSPPARPPLRQEALF